MTARFLGIDPGAGGAMVVIEDKRVVAVRAMPVVMTDKGKRRVVPQGVVNCLRELMPVDYATIELVGPMPRDGSAGSFWFGKSAGIVECACVALGIPVGLISPVKWKRRLDVPADKGGARKRATAIFGTGEHWPLVKDDGKAEAALIALYGQLEALCRGSSVAW